MLIKGIGKAVRAWVAGRLDAHPRVDRLHKGFVSEWRAILIFSLLLVLASNLFFEIVEDFAIEDPFSAIDLAIFDALQTLRGPWLDTVMVAITKLGDTVPVLVVTLAVAGWLIIMRAWRPLAFFLVAVGGGALLNSVMKLTLQRARPLELYTQGVDVFSFPSGHTTSNALLYGFLIVLISRETTWPFRALIACGLGLLVAAIAISRAYLGAHWASDIAGGLTFAVTWIALLAVFYMWRSAIPVASKGLLITVAAALLIVGGGHIVLNHSDRLAHYQTTAARTAPKPGYGL